MSEKELTPLSASRIKLLQTCSWSYWARYILKVPDKSNDGASRGTVCHLIFEVLGNPRHLRHYDSIVMGGTIKSSDSVYKLVEYHAKKLSVNDEENMQMIDKMILNGLNYDFFGGSTEDIDLAISEKDFSIVVDEDGKKYKIRGFIDKLFLYKNKSAIIRDFKTSKQVFKGKELTDNLQDLMYSLAVSKLYPGHESRYSEFLFLKFNLGKDLLGNKGKGVVSMEKISDDELEGFEHQLTEIQKTIDNFDSSLARSSFAAKKGYPKDGTFGGPLVCGKKGYKKSRGEYVLDSQGNKIKSYICPFREPLDFFVLKDKKGNIVRSAFTKQELVSMESDDLTVEKSSYDGCPHWQNKESLSDLLDI
jgi:hypothetical protein